MKWFSITSMIVWFALFQPSTAAQPITPVPPPDDPLVTRLPGIMTFPIFDGELDATILLDTMDGTTRRIDGIRAAQWSPDASQLVGVSRQGLTLSTLEVQRSDTRITGVQTQTSPIRDYNQEVRQLFAGWSADSDRIMLVNGILGRQIVYGLTRWQLEIISTDTGQSSIVLDVPSFTPMESLFYVPTDYVEMVLDDIKTAHWNPIYPDWVFLQVIGNGKHATEGDERSWIEAGMYNFQTGEYISVTTLFPQTVISTTDWSPDGTKIAMNTMTGISVIRFTVNDGVPRLQLLADGVDTFDQAVRGWIVGDILTTGITKGYSRSGYRAYRTSFLGHIIDGQWNYQEFVALDSPNWGAGVSRNFIFTGTPEQEAEISCMFFNSVYPPRLAAGTRGRVTFTDGTPSRLRAAPGTHPANTVVTQMQEGTPFIVTGTAYCVDGYRWWPITLDDGVTGWAAEGTSSEAWLEPLE